MITNSPNVKRGNIARTLLIILGVVIALYLSVSSGAFSAQLAPQDYTIGKSPLAEEEVVPSAADEKNIFLPILTDAGEHLLSKLDLKK